MEKIAIIGAGASGIMAAMVAKNKNNSIDLYEKNSSIAKKIRASGNGRCNITNRNITKYDYFGNNLDFLEYGLREFDFFKFEKLCNNMGLYLSVQDDGKVYPCSFESASVVKIFEEKLDEKGINISLKSEIIDITKQKDKFMLQKSDKSIKFYDKVLISTGSKAASKLGGNSFGEKIAKKFGHHLFPSYPSLVQLETKEREVIRLSGVKIWAKVTLHSKIDKDISILGDVLFTRYGLSGFAILDISPFVSKLLLENKEVILSIDMLPKFSVQMLQSILIKSCKNNPNSSFETILLGLLPQKVANNISFKLGFKSKKMKDLSLKDIKKSVYAIKDCRYSIKDTHGYEYAEVCGGGIDTLQIDPKSLESKLVKNLYFLGESLDIVGKRGGYNLAFAWMSGYLAGRGINPNKERD